MTVSFVRTPEENFADLPGWDFQPHYLEQMPGFEGLRLHYIDEGPPDGEVYLCLHGEPTWSYLYRKMIPVFLNAKKRVIAFDWYGFGRSDKPIDDDVYTFEFHRNTLLRFVEAINLSRCVVVCQDWGGILGLTLPADKPDLISGLIAMNTTLAQGDKPSPGFLAWRDFVRRQPDLNVGRLMKRAIPTLSQAEVEAYDAPFPSAQFKAGVRRFPDLVPTEMGMIGIEVSRRAAQFWSQSWQGPSFLAVGSADPVLGKDIMMKLRQVIRGCPPLMELPSVGHFVQEYGEQVAVEALAAFNA